MFCNGTVPEKVAWIENYDNEKNEKQVGNPGAKEEMPQNFQSKGRYILKWNRAQRRRKGLKSR